MFGLSSIYMIASKPPFKHPEESFTKQFPARSDRILPNQKLPLGLGNKESKI